MPKNPVVIAQQKLYESMGEGCTAEDIRKARKELQEEWDNATPAQREYVLRNAPRRR